MNKLKPVVFVQGKYAYNNQNSAQQILLLKALKITQDPKKLKEMIGVRTVAEVMRTLDKIVMRKEYHSALARLGITFDYVAKGIKKEIDTAEKSADRLAGLNMLLKSIGLDKYDDTSIGGGTWEDALLKIRQEEEETGEVKEIAEYSVVTPEMPEAIRLAKEKANIETKKLYD